MPLLTVLDRGMLLACCYGAGLVREVVTLRLRQVVPSVKMRSMPVWLQIGASLAAALIGGVIAPQVTQTKDRRAARAAVREKIDEVDALRWEDQPYLEFRRAIASFEAAAILARVPRSAARRFAEAATEARQESQHFPEGPDGEPITILLDDAKEEAVLAAVSELSLRLWHPWLAKIRLRVG
ncbi:hypothetical protein [Prauserella shujinwangii]|uniref:hypothetical protein n=1 Tax=Prauserella shujinwangii TaxID=1453103 RepID=UPI0011B29E11|nr:hypothetical protein [Prauserella shujinwangii]